jgi:putative endonuclease
VSSAAGRDGEAAAAEYLETLGYRILKRNLRGPGGEIDLIARDGDTLVFVEVKSRGGVHFGSALSAVDARKRARIRTLAEDFLQFLPATTKVRFDVVTLRQGRATVHRGAFM